MFFDDSKRRSHVTCRHRAWINRIRSDVQATNRDFGFEAAKEHVDVRRRVVFGVDPKIESCHTKHRRHTTSLT